MGKGNESVFAASGSVTEMAATPIYVVKPFKNLLVRKQVDRYPRNLVCSIGEIFPS